MDFISKIFEPFLYYVTFYRNSIVVSLLAVLIIEYIFKYSIEAAIKKKTKNSKKHIFFLKDYIYIIFQVIAAIILVRLAPVHRDITVKATDMVRYYELTASDFFIYLAEVGFIYNVLLKIIVRKIKGKGKGE